MTSSPRSWPDLGLGAVFTEGVRDLDWVKRVFDSSDLPDHISWKELLPQGILTSCRPKSRVPPAGGHALVRGRPDKRICRNPIRCHRQFAEEFGKGLQTPSGKLEFVPEILKRNTADNPDRPPLNRYMPSWEGLRATELASIIRSR